MTPAVGYTKCPLRKRGWYNYIPAAAIRRRLQIQSTMWALGFRSF